MTRRSVLLIALVAFVGIGAVTAYNVREERKLAEVMARVDAAAQRRSVISYQAYLLIRPGMRVDDVIAVLGSAGKEVSRAEVPPVPGAMPRTVNTIHQWENADGSNVIVMFENGEVVSVSQAGL